ncbi:MAG: peptidyl-prolyl cis-trans isomerase [Actinobacteria bacterium]|nr:peptidyl-prolyl cis-trans isomerase [Actinomycetota bacterium]
MKKRARRVTYAAAALAVLAVLLVLAGCGSSSVSLAKVNGQDITKAEVDREVKFRDGCSAAGKPGTAQFKSYETQMVDVLVSQQIINSEAAKKGISVSDNEISQAITEEQNALGGSAKLKQQESCAGVSDDQLRNMMKDDLYFRKLIANVTKNDPPVTDAEAQDYYNQHKNDQTFQAPETRRVRHILVSDLATAQKIKAQLDAGADFATLAKQYSIDPGSKDNGGELTTSDGSPDIPSQNSGFVPAFEQAMDKLSAGQISDPVKTQFGWHIIQVESIKPAGLESFNQVKDSLKQGLAMEREQQTFNTWMAGARQRYRITYSPGWAPATTAPSSGQTTPSGS